MNSFRNLHQPTGRQIVLEGESYRFFGGTAYLGLLDNPEYIELYKRGIDRYGLNNGTSRTNNLQLGIYNQAEHALAQRFGFSDAVLCSSGYLAAQLAVRSLTAGRTVFYAPSCHPSLWLNEQPAVLAAQFEQWSQSVVREINESNQTTFAIISNALDNLTPEIYDFSIFLNIDKSKNVLLILDDSHGIGVINENSVSIDLKEIQKSHLKVVVVASLAKGLGTDAGVLLADKELLDLARKHPIFTGASPSSPAAIYALLHGEKIYKEAFLSLQENIDFVQRALKEVSGFNFIDHFAVLSSTDPEISAMFLKHKILISSFAYPLPSSPLLNRIIITSLHTNVDLAYLLEVISTEFRLKV